jgi:ketosteroid isomerase-like protein
VGIDAKIAAEMSEAEVEVVRRAAEAWAAGGVEALLELADLEIEWRSRSDLPDSDLYEGHDGVRRLYQLFADELEDMYFEPVEMIDAEDGVVVLVLNWGGKGRSSGIQIEERGEAWVMRVANGKVVRVDEYPNKNEALKAFEA